jgi:hypothetical protein
MICFDAPIDALCTRTAWRGAAAIAREAGPSCMRATFPRSFGQMIAKLQNLGQVNKKCAAPSVAPMLRTVQFVVPKVHWLSTGWGWPWLAARLGAMTVLLAVSVAAAVVGTPSSWRAAQPVPHLPDNAAELAAKLAAMAQVETDKDNVRTHRTSRPHGARKQALHVCVQTPVVPASVQSCGQQDPQACKHATTHLFLMLHHVLQQSCGHAAHPIGTTSWATCSDTSACAPTSAHFRV